ncbi:FMRFamide-activated amiloride-sensitive sodium channel-like [Dermacentor albipictus]|uniref:FMRFamide-activated amiloride-sensitive sodium channel-like n=1 Tax=Dermacentor albipictus TaxID=60249 RepID=UPI0038FC04D2
MSCQSLTSTYAGLFAKKSPVAGLDIFFNRRPNAWRKASWMAIMIVLCYLTASGWQSAIGGYFAFDVTVSLETSVNMSFGFPDVTICSSSLLKEPKTCSSQLEATNITDMIFNDQEFKEIADKLETNIAKLQVQSGNMLQEAYFKATDLMVGCRFFGVDCNLEKIWESDVKGCFTLHEARMLAHVPSLEKTSEKKHEDVFKKRLELILDPCVKDYLPSVSEVGFPVLIQTPGTTPSQTSDAVLVPPGFTTYIGLTLLVQTGLEAPYKKQCALDWPQHLAFYGSLSGKAYSKQDCTQTCMQVIALELCRCQSHRWPFVITRVKGNYVPVCESSELYKCCLVNFLRGKDLLKVRWNKFNKPHVQDMRDANKYESILKKEFDHRGNVEGGNKSKCFYEGLPTRKIKDTCKCFRRCQDFTYRKTVTYVPFSSENASTAPGILQGGLSKVVVYFSTPNIDNIRTVPKFDGLQAFSAMGSANGMYLGASFLVIIEVFEILLAGCSRSQAHA